MAFRSVLQGDHAGVQVACASHQQLLRHVGLLNYDRTILGTRPWVHPKEMQGLVIDDFFNVAVSPKDAETTKDVIDFDIAQDAYGEAKLEGSPDKDVRGSDTGKVIWWLHQWFSVQSIPWYSYGFFPARETIWHELDYPSSLPTTSLLRCAVALSPGWLDVNGDV